MLPFRTHALIDADKVSECMHRLVRGAHGHFERTYVSAVRYPESQPQGWLTRASQASRMTSRTCASARTCLAQPHLANPRRAILHFGFRGRSPGDIWAKSRPFPAP